jgi:hypothetical protein
VIFLFADHCCWNTRELWRVRLLQRRIPSHTKNLAVPSDASKVFKVHSWNVLNIDKIDNGNGRYSVRTDFNMAIADNAWSSEDIAILSLQEICKSSVEQFAVENNIPAANYKFLDYKGSSYSGSNSVAYDKDIAGCRAGSNDSSDDYGLAIISRGEVLDSALI